MMRFLFVPRIFNWNIFDSVWMGFMSGIYLVALHYTPESFALLVWLLFILIVIPGSWFSAKMQAKYDD